jgi:hypothetical protein
MREGCLVARDDGRQQGLNFYHPSCIGGMTADEFWRLTAAVRRDHFLLQRDPRLRVVTCARS